MTRPAWHADAACTAHDPDLFTCEPNERRSGGDVNRMRIKAARVCSGCPVKNECLAAAEAGRRGDRVPGSHDILVLPFGVLGGMFYNGTRHPPTSPIRDGEVLQSIADGLPDGVIAERHGVTIDIIRGIRRRLGIGRVQGQSLIRGFQHGSLHGAQCHRRRGEQPCDPCRDADNERKRQQRLKEKARQQDDTAA